MVLHVILLMLRAYNIPQNLGRCVLDWYHFYLNLQVVVDLQKYFDTYVIGNDLSLKQSCIISHARYVTGSKKERLFMDICHFKKCITKTMVFGACGPDRTI